MYCIDRDDGEYWIYRLMVDKAHQNKGYGRSAMEKVIETIKQDKARHNIYLGVDMDGGASVPCIKASDLPSMGRCLEKSTLWFWSMLKAGILICSNSFHSCFCYIVLGDDCLSICRYFKSVFQPFKVQIILYKLLT